MLATRTSTRTSVNNDRRRPMQTTCFQNSMLWQTMKKAWLLIDHHQSFLYFQDGGSWIKLAKRTTIKLVYVTAMFCAETLCHNDAASKKFTVITKSQRCHAMESSVTTQINSDKIQVSYSFRYYVSLCNKLERKIRENQNAIP